MTKPVPPTWLADPLGSGRRTPETQGRCHHLSVVVPVVAILAVDTRTAVQGIAIQREPGVFL